MSNPFDEMSWLHEPTWRIDSDSLIVRTQHDSDFWQRTHYGFQRDNGHALLKKVSGNVKVRARFRFEPTAQYDQCGIFLRVNEDNWFKCSIEFENASESRLGSVLTTNGYSDWATQDITSDVKDIWYEVELKNSGIISKYSFDGITFRQMRVCRLGIGAHILFAGIYGCSPVGNGFEFTVSNLSITDA